MNIKTFIINLENQKLRKIYMENLLKDKNFDIEWIKAIDGDNLSDQQILKYFDLKKYILQNKYNIKRSEIGCTLSHRLCYEQIYKDKLKYAFIIEDDIIFVEDIEPYFPSLINFLKTKKPVIILLSGFFFFSSKRPINNNKFLCKVFDARLTHSYLINYNAARIILETIPYYRADNWLQIKKLGINIFGVHPHLIDQNLKLISSSSIRFTSCSKSRKIYLRNILNNKINGIIRRFLRYTNKLEPAQTIFD